MSIVGSVSGSAPGRNVLARHMLPCRCCCCIDRRRSRPFTAAYHNLSCSTRVSVTRSIGGYPWVCRVRAVVDLTFTLHPMCRSVTMSTSAIDSLQNALVDTISGVYLKRVRLIWVRLLVLALTVPCMIVSLKVRLPHGLSASQLPICMSRCNVIGFVRSSVRC